MSYCLTPMKGVQCVGFTSGHLALRPPAYSNVQCGGESPWSMRSRLMRSGPMFCVTVLVTV
jgi:hypothetical protein